MFLIQSIQTNQTVPYSSDNTTDHITPIHLIKNTHNYSSMPPINAGPIIKISTNEIKTSIIDQLCNN